MSRIVSLQSTNYKRLKAVRIEPDPDGNLVVVGGKNAQGKSSVLDSITAALGGVNAKTTPKPIRDGEDRAEIILETEDFVVTRRFTAGGSTLTLKSHDGAVYPKAQAKLDDWLGTLALDPLAFTQLSDKEQLKALLDLVELPFDPVKLDAERADLFSQRTEVNRELKQAKAAADSIQVTKEMSELQPVNVSDLLAKYRASKAAQDEVDARLKDLWSAEAELERVEGMLREARERVADATRASDQAFIGARAHEAAEDIQEKLDSVEQNNADVNTYQSWVRATERAGELQAESADLTGQIDAIDKSKAEGLAAAVFPVDDLGFDESGVSFKGVPFKQASSAEQLRVSLAMAIALNPKLRVIRIADGSLLDSDNLALVESIAREHDFQVWIEMVGDGDGRGIIIDDGEVKE
ncbi:AAA domain-containing protein [Arthrobacter sp. cf158]|uniref:AAA family ATPase n=1 Tax=Arthrobacter sp. cf158 TaxID=1761744 RepID=UPI0008998602|nr:ATP-binding protein [Arthrobacter sp. cf158]SDW34080.1 AAA domain-containing protein [Arthrobacter sp. cf158]